jgi:hypothetical protein
MLLNWFNTSFLMCDFVDEKKRLLEINNLVNEKNIFDRTASAHIVFLTVKHHSFHASVNTNDTFRGL